MTKNILIELDEEEHRAWNTVKAMTGKTWKDMLKLSVELLKSYYESGVEGMVRKMAEELTEKKG